MITFHFSSQQSVNNANVKAEQSRSNRAYGAVCKVTYVAVSANGPKGLVVV